MDVFRLLQDRFFQIEGGRYRAGIGIEAVIAPVSVS